MKIAIAGYGQEGESSYRYYSQIGDNQITIADERQPVRPLPFNVKAVIGDNAFGELNGYDMIIRTPSVPPSKIITDGKVWSVTNEFFSKCPAQIIGVTGTKGKGTTSSLIAAIFETTGRRVWLLGNIGKPAIDYLDRINKDDVVVYELSSFQLWDIEKSPQYAVVLPISPEHLDVHKDYADYVSSKANICRFQTESDTVIYHAFNDESKSIASMSKGRKISYDDSDGGGAYVKYGQFIMQDETICSLSDLQLIGAHNQENACAAISVAKCYGVSNESIRKGLQSFKGLEHRLEFVRDVNGVSYYNDSFSSSPTATLAAIRSFKQPEILIMGGVDRGADFESLIEKVCNADNIKTIILTGSVKDKLRHMLDSCSNAIELVIDNVGSMESIVEIAHKHAASGDVVLLSPGCASFDMFKDFYDRGDQFKTEVNKL